MKKRAYIFYGGWQGHEPDKVSARFEKMLLNENYEVVRESTLDRLVDKEFLSGFDLIVPCWTQGKLSDLNCFRLSEVIMSGVGMAGNHGGMCDSFRPSVEWHFMTGSQWVTHPGDKYYHHLSSLEPENLELVKQNFPDPPPDGYWTHYTVNFKKNSSSPLIEGLEDFDVFTEQYYLHVDPSINVLATTQIKTQGPHSPNGEVTMPVTYTKLWGDGRVFYTSMGHLDNIFEIPQVSEMMRRGFLWATRK